MYDQIDKERRERQREIEAMDRRFGVSDDFEPDPLLEALEQAALLRALHRMAQESRTVNGTARNIR